MNRKQYATWSKIDLAQFKQLMSGPVWRGDLISRQSAHALIDQGFVDVDDDGSYSLNEYGEGIAAIVRESETEEGQDSDILGVWLPGGGERS